MVEILVFRLFYINFALTTIKLKKNNMKESTPKQVISLKNLTKSSVWDIQENDVFRMLNNGSKDAEVKDNLRHYVDIVRSAFTMEEIKDDKPAIRQSYEKQGYKVGLITLDENIKTLWAVRKRPIMRVTDLTYENIRHISASKLIEVLERNFGGGWDSLSQSIQDIIESGFDISTTTLPKDRLHKKDGMYEKKVADGYEVLEVPKGTWVEAIFAKLKPEVIKPRMKFDSVGEDEDLDDVDNYDNMDEDEDMDEFNEDDINEENYRTTFEIESDEDEEVGELSEYGVEE